MIEEIRMRHKDIHQEQEKQPRGKSNNYQYGLDVEIRKGKTDRHWILILNRKC